MKNTAILGFARLLRNPWRSARRGRCRRPSGLRTARRSACPRQAIRSAWTPSQTRYTAPTIFKVRNAGSDRRRSAATPTLAASDHTASPSTTPTEVETATRRPPKSAFRPTSAMSGPGATITTAETARNGIRFTGRSLGLHGTPDRLESHHGRRATRLLQVQDEAEGDESADVSEPPASSAPSSPCPTRTRSGRSWAACPPRRCSCSSTSRTIEARSVLAGS